MSDKQRYKLLRKKVITLAECHPEKLTDINVDLHELETTTKKIAKPLIRKVANEFGIIGEFCNQDIELSFNVSQHTFRESINKQEGTFTNYGKMMTCFEEIIENAVGVEVHGDRYGQDPTLKRVYTLMSGFKDEKIVVPVKLEVKELENKANKLYLAVALEPIQKAAILTQSDPKSSSYIPAASVEGSSTFDNISIPQFVKNINPIDGDFLKYLPDRFLNKQQIQAKMQALARQETYIARKIQREQTLKQAIKVGSGRKISAIMQPQRGTSTGATTAPIGDNVKNNTRKNVRKKGGFWGL